MLLFINLSLFLLGIFEVFVSVLSKFVVVVVIVVVVVVVVVVGLRLYIMLNEVKN